MDTTHDDTARDTPDFDPPTPRRRFSWWFVAWLIFLAAVVGSILWSVRHGWEFRKQAWEYFEPARFRGDIWRNFYFGTLALRDGLLNLYDDQAADPPEERRRLNYPPMRTVVFARWAKSTGEPERTPDDREPRWESGLAFNRVLQDFNTVIALCGAVAAGLLVQHWIRRHNRLAYAAEGRAPPRSWWAWAAAAIAFGLYWYNPAGLILGHGWPSPNAWLMPFFLWALLFASWELWFIAGVTIGIGAMFQGQHLLVAPFWILWPIFAGQPMRAVRWMIGFSFGFLVIASGWLLTVRPAMALPDRHLNPAAIVWMIGGVVAVLAIPMLRRFAECQSDQASEDDLDGIELAEADGSENQPPADSFAEPVDVVEHPRGIVNSALLFLGGSLFVAIILLIWPAIIYGRLFSLLTGGVILASVGLVALLWWRGWRAVRYAIPGLIAAQLLLCIPLFDASTSWWEVGFRYGTERHDNMAVGKASNLGSLLRTKYGWRKTDEVVTTLEDGALLGIIRADAGESAESSGLFSSLRDPDITIKELMLAIYLVTLTLASIATAIQWRRGNRNFLLAATAPWVLMALIPAQMHERYLGFAGLAAAVWIGAGGGVGWAMLGMFLSIVTYVQVLIQMIESSGRRVSRGEDPLIAREYFGWFSNGEMMQAFNRAFPDIAWALLLAAAMVLVGSFMRAAPTARLPAPLIERELARD